MDIFLAARPTVCLLAETLAGPLTSALADALNDICSLQTRQPDVLAPEALARDHRALIRSSAAKALHIARLKQGLL